MLEEAKYQLDPSRLSIRELQQYISLFKQFRECLGVVLLYSPNREKKIAVVFSKSAVILVKTLKTVDYPELSLNQLKRHLALHLMEN